jgi:hypothetical protein
MSSTNNEVTVADDQINPGPEAEANQNAIRNSEEEIKHRTLFDDQLNQMLEHGKIMKIMRIKRMCR